MALETMTPKVPDSSAKVERYSQVIVQFLTQLSDRASSSNGVETQQLFDLQHHRYLLLDVGWRGQERVYAVAIHLDIQDGKVWIQRNQTEVEIDANLIELGIPEEDIVLGLIPPEYRLLAGLNSEN